MLPAINMIGFQAGGVGRAERDVVRLAGAGASRLAPRFQHYGALFLGAHGAEVFGPGAEGAVHAGVVERRPLAL